MTEGDQFRSSELLRETKKRQDRDDLDNEMAGREVGRIKRFLPEGHAGPAAQKRRDEEREHLSALMAMLRSNAAYAALYDQTMDALRNAEAATEAALTEARDTLDNANEALADLMDNANTLPDGTKVFRNQNGNVYTEDGRLIEGEELQGIHWRDNAPNYEDFLARRKAVSDAQATIDAILRYQTDILGHARGRLAAEDSPPTKEELEEIRRDIEARMPEAVASQESIRDPELAQSDQHSATVDIPKL